MGRAAARVAGLIAFLCQVSGWSSGALAQTIAVASPFPDPAPVNQPPSVLEPALAPSLPTAVAAGKTRNSFSVSPTGQATYSIPLLTPRGINGLTPGLSLSYASGSGDGMYGVGWSVTGFSAISRCGKTVAQDGLSANIFLATTDLYCLDGNKLRSFGGTTYGTDGAQYQTELADFSLVISHGTAGNGPAWFEVHGKNGLIYQYGNTAHAALIATGTSTVVTWALNSITDRFGNHIDFDYTNDATDQVLRPLTITYTTPPIGLSGVQAQANYQVQFAYVSRTSPVPGGFIIGAQFMEPYLAQTITLAAWNGSTYASVRTYNLTYATGGATGRSLLHTIQECSPTQCFSPTTVNYQSGTAGWSSAAALGGASQTLSTAMVGDLNGDGIDDIVYRDKTTNHLYYLLGSTAGTYSGPYDTGLTATFVAPIDFNSDGKMDLITVNSSGKLRINYYSSPGGAFTFTDTTAPAPSAPLGYQGYVLVGDVDGDGRDDLIYAISGGSSWQTPDFIYYRINNGTDFGAQQLLKQVGTSGCSICKKLLNYPFGQFTHYNSRVRRVDVNGDGRFDFFVDIGSCGLDDNGQCVSPTYKWNLAVSDALSNVYDFLDTLSNGALGSATYVPPLIGDFDGDGCSDVAYTQSNVWYVQYGTCLRTGSSFALSAAVNTGVAASGIYPMALDWDGDGRDDIVSADSTTGHIGYMHSTGTTFGPWTSTGIPYTNSDTSNFVALVLDVHGDGQYGFVYPGAGSALMAYAHSGTGITPDLATSFLDGFGFTYSPSYAQITNGTYYTKNTGAAYPEQDYQGASTVVSSYTASDGITLTGTYNVSFHYYWGRLNVAGRGFEGFGAVRAIDSRNGLYTFNYYSQLFPNTGMVSESTLSNSSGTIYLATTNTNTSHTLDATYKRYFPFVSQSVKNIYELGGALDGTLITQSTTTYSYTGTNGFTYGNLSQVARTTIDEDPTSPWTGKTYTDTVNFTPYELGGTSSTGWCIHLSSQVSEQRTQPGGATLTHTAAYGVNQNSDCEIDSQTVEPSSAVDKITTTYGYTDGCGNINATTVTGLNPDGTAMSPRTSKAAYGTHCIYPETLTNALLQTSSIGYRYDLGLAISSIDLNNLPTSWTYNDIGQKTLEQRPDGTQTSYSLTACTSNCGFSVPIQYYLTTLDQDSTSGHATFRSHYDYYDQLGRPVEDEVQNADGQLIAAVTAYDALGRTVKKSSPYLSTSSTVYYTTSIYDALNRVTSTSRPISATNPTLESTNYTYQGRTQAAQDPKGYTTTRQSDVLGELSIVTDPDGVSKTNYSYNPFGQLTLIQDPAGNPTTRTFDTLGYLLTGSSDPDRGTWTFQYDSLGELVNLRDAKTTAPAWTQQLSYDALGRTLTRTETEGTTTWTWGTSQAAHEIGQLKQLSGLGDTETYTFDSAARPSTRSMAWGGNTYTVSYGYNTLGTLDQLNYPLAPGQVNQFAVKYGYTNGYLSSLQNFTGGVGGTTFWKLTPGVTNVDPWGHMTDETLGTTTVVRIQSAFDGVTGWINTRTVGSGGSLTNLSNLGYQWDLNGNLSQRADVNRSLTEAITNDSLNRIQSSTLNGTQNLSLVIDNVGDITSRTSFGTTYPYTYDTTHKHAVATVGGTLHTYTYDANGNMATRDGFSILWSSANQPTAINASGVSSGFYYGPDRQRKQQVATYNAEGDSGTETTTYVFGLYEHEVTPAQTHDKYFVQVPGGTQIIYDIQSVSGTQITYITADHLGSASVLINSAGSVLTTESYEAYGRRRAATWNTDLTSTDSSYTTIASTTRRGFTDGFHEFLDNLTLIHMNGRVYDPISGRFMSPDPVVTKVGDSQRGNPYSYVENRPLTVTDPTGLNPFKQCIDFCYKNTGTPHRRRVHGFGGDDFGNGGSGGSPFSQSPDWGSVGAGADFAGAGNPTFDSSSSTSYVFYYASSGPTGSTDSAGDVADATSPNNAPNPPVPADAVAPSSSTTTAPDASGGPGPGAMSPPGIGVLQLQYLPLPDAGQTAAAVGNGLLDFLNAVATPDLADAQGVQNFVEQDPSGAALAGGLALASILAIPAAAVLGPPALAAGARAMQSGIVAAGLQGAPEVAPEVVPDMIQQLNLTRGVEGVEQIEALSTMISPWSRVFWIQVGKALADFAGGE